MKKYCGYLKQLLPAIGMLALIFDSRTGFAGAAEGVEICIRTVVPSLLPFFVLSSLLISSFSGKEIRILSPLGKICGIPKGQESLLLVGLLGGYPIGAQGVYHAWKAKAIDSPTAKRMLGFCNNSGPSFIFGIAASLFSSKLTGILLWLIQIISALIAGAMLSPNHLSGQNSRMVSIHAKKDVIYGATKALASVCGWVVLMRVILAFVQRWFLWLLPEPTAIVISGLLELTNGCCDLCRISSEPIRFILCNAILSCGGVCVLMQTVSVTKDLGTGWYIPGKILQCSVSIAISVMLSPIIFQKTGIYTYPYLAFSLAGLLIFMYMLKIKKK